jgi:hypothetical protein
MKTLFTLLFLILSVSCGTKNEWIHIQWVDDPDGDFSFAEQWSYADNVFTNEFGQLVCDGICDEALFEMQDEYGRIFDDSLIRYYQLPDTTRYYHTVACDADAPEWAGTDFAYAYKSGDTIKCYTMCNAGTHGSLGLSVINDICIPRIMLNSVAKPGIQYFEVKDGSIRIGSMVMGKGILKAEFDFRFINPADAGNPMWWKGKIYTEIDERFMKN